MILDIIIILLVAYLLYGAYKLHGKVKSVEKDYQNIAAVNSTMWSMIQDNERKRNKGKTKRAGTKTEAGRVEPRANKATPGIGKGVKRKK